ncbi:MAG: hypothetical protein J0H98_05735 [Solirubrobacterales bacterium]|nr:hypothetical protein [Solirubrobacterales bacterium]
MAAARTVGVVVGLCSLLLLLAVSRPESREPRLGVSLDLGVVDRGELEISRVDPLPVISADLVAGRVAAGRLEVRNITDLPLRVGLVLPLSESEARTLAAAQIRVRVARGRTVLADTTIPGLIRGTALTRLGPGREADLSFRAWIGGQDPGLYAGQDVTGRLDFQLEPGGGWP